MKLRGWCLQVLKLVDDWIEDQVLRIDENKCALIPITIYESIRALFAVTLFVSSVFVMSSLGTPESPVAAGRASRSARGSEYKCPHLQAMLEISPLKRSEMNSGKSDVRKRPAFMAGSSQQIDSGSHIRSSLVCTCSIGKCLIPYTESGIAISISALWPSCRSIFAISFSKE